MKKSTLLFLALVFTILSSLHSQSYVDPKIPLLLAAERDKLPVDGELLYPCENLSVYSFSSNNGATKKIVDAESTDPFDDEVVLSYTLDQKAELSFQFYSMDGALVSSATASHTTAGKYSSKFDFSDLPSGIYMCVVDGEKPELSRSILKIVKR